MILNQDGHLKTLGPSGRDIRQEMMDKNGSPSPSPSMKPKTSG
jgi:hypothetical protein